MAGIGSSIGCRSRARRCIWRTVRTLSASPWFGVAATADPTPLPKVEGDFGQVINVSADDPIDFVTIKSGQGAFLVSAEFDTTSGTITLSKDVSNYVVWTCEGSSFPS